MDWVVTVNAAAADADAVVSCSDIGGMVSLAYLDVSHNSLHHLAPQLSSLVALTHLEASDNKLHQSTAVPEELATLTALKVRVCVCHQGRVHSF